MRASVKTPNYYLVREKLFSSTTPGWRVVNAEEVFEGTGRRNFSPPSSRRGFLDYPATPRIEISKKLGHVLRDIEYIGAYWLINDKTKRIFDQIFITDFAYLRLDIDECSDSDPPYWLCDVLPVLSALDIEKSRVRMSPRKDDGSKPMFSLSVVGGASVVINSEIVKSHKVFRLDNSPSRIFCGDEFRSAIKDNNLAGLKFIDALKI